MAASLWQPIDVGDLRLEHRLVMAPMTRDRATPEGVPTETNAVYYAQRASTALIITEGTQPSPDGQGYLLTPGGDERGYTDYPTPRRRSSRKPRSRSHVAGQTLKVDGGPFTV